MKSIALVFLISSFMLSWYSCSKDDNNTPKNIPVTEKQQQLLNSDNTFGLNLFREMLKTEEAGKNIFISPLSVAIALAMTYNGADNDTKLAMEQTLQTNGLTTEEINDAYKYLIKALLQADPAVTITIANSIWYRDNFPVLADFLNVNKSYYSASVTPLDFDNPASKDLINNWVANSTNQKIKTIIEEINPENVMFLINAIYFKGQWRYKFQKSTTADANFTLSNGSIATVKMMSQKNTFRYFENSLFQALELPYGNGLYNMIVLLPQSDKTTADIATELSDANWKTWMNSFGTASTMDIKLPKFTFEYKKTLNDLLTTLGMGIAFSDMADFTKINASGGLYISEVKHKTFVEVNEEGTEAAAATSVGISFTSMPPSFLANKPFLFFIREKSTGAILFAGKVEDPR